MGADVERRYSQMKISVDQLKNELIRNPMTDEPDLVECHQQGAEICPQCVVNGNGECVLPSFYILNQLN